MDAVVRLLVADDHAVVRAGIRSVLESQNGWKVVAEACDGREAVEKARQVKPAVAVLDITMPVLNGLEATRQITAALPSAQVLILTVHDSEVMAQQVLQAGARGYLLKLDVGHDLIAAVDALLHNRTYLTSTVSRLIMDGYLGKGPRAGEEKSGVNGSLRLTSREREIIQLLAEGKSSKEVASLLNISVKTAETHRANLMRKLGCHSVVELVRYAVRNMIVQP
jgi:DNA-binding NarL/FixJ family response regulator